MADEEATEVGDTGETKIHWSDKYEGLSDDTKTLLTKYDTEQAAFEGHVSLDKLRGNSIALPKEDATDEEKVEQMGKIFDKLGRPETPEGYELAIPAELPESLKPTDEAVAEFYKWSHGQGLSQAQMQAIAELQAQKIIGSMEASKAAQEAANANVESERAAKREKDLAELKVEWGEDFDKKMDLAEEAYEVYGKNRVERAKLFYEIYLKKLAEDALIPGRTAVTESENFFDYGKKKG